MMPGWGYWVGYGWVGGLFTVALMILFWGGLITAAVLVIRRHRAEPDSAHRILDERFARGEIDQAEYEKVLETLRSGRTA